jgi:endonuclease-3
VQTKDETTDKMMSQLKDFGCTAKILSETPPEKIKELIYGSNFNKTKSENINKIANIIMKDYKGKMPTQYGEILAFPGVGHKIAILYFQSTTEESFGIAVDTHVHR